MPEDLRTLAIVEDDKDLREALAKLVATAPNWQVKAAFPNAERALPALIAEPVDLVLMDIQLPGMSGIECVARLREAHPSVRVLMLTVYDHSERVFEALSAGASGYLLKRDIPSRLIGSLNEAFQGSTPFSSAVARHMLEHFLVRKPTPSEPDWNLTQRESEILKLLVQGALYKEIADQLGIGITTVRFHLRNIYDKLHVSTRTEAVVKYLGH